MQWSTPSRAPGLPPAVADLAGSAAQTRTTGRGPTQRRRARRGDGFKAGPWPARMRQRSRPPAETRIARLGGEGLPET